MRGDVQARLLIDARVEAQRILKAAEQQIESNGDLLAPRSGRRSTPAMQALRDAAAGKDHRAVQGRNQRLDHVSAEFAKRVMDRGIERALKGHSVGEFDQGELSPHAKKAYFRLARRLNAESQGLRSTRQAGGRRGGPGRDPISSKRRRSSARSTARRAAASARARPATYG